MSDSRWWEMDCASKLLALHSCLQFLCAAPCEAHYQKTSNENPATRNRTRDHLIAAALYSQMLYQLSYSRVKRWNYHAADSRQLPGAAAN